MFKEIISFIAVLCAITLGTTPAFAHSVVKPSQVGVAAFQDFLLGVPSEKDAATTTVKLILPAGLNFVTPVVKPGWKVEVKSGPIPTGVKAPIASDGDIATTIPTEIDWTGGSIPAGQKDIFVFSAQVPAQPVELDWKIYQSYADGSTISWDLNPNDPQPKDSKGNPDFSTKGPYSKTMVINDLTGSGAKGAIQTSNMSTDTDLRPYSSNKLAVALGGLGFLLGAASLVLQFKKK